jgi:hypothetical protein
VINLRWFRAIRQISVYAFSAEMAPAFIACRSKEKRWQQPARANGNAVKQTGIVSSGRCRSMTPVHSDFSANNYQFHSGQ